MPIPKLTETTIRHHATAQSYDRGEAYYRSGAVITLIGRGNTLLAQIEGNEVGLAEKVKEKEQND